MTSTARPAGPPGATVPAEPRSAPDVAAGPESPAGPGQEATPVLIIEDEPDIARAITAVLESGGLRVQATADGRAGLRAFHAGRPALVILDVGLPVLDGWTVLNRIRDLSEVPVLMLTARDSEEEKVRGLRAGADDYVIKPFGHAELLARAQALLRRARPAAPAADVYDDGWLRVAFADGAVRVSDRPVSLTPTEFRLLTALVRQPGHVLSPAQLLERAWQDPSGIGPDRVKFTVMRLRRKLGQTGPGPVEAVRGFGYRYRPPSR